MFVSCHLSSSPSSICWIAVMSCQDLRIAFCYVPLIGCLEVIYLFFLTCLKLFYKHSYCGVRAIHLSDHVDKLCGLWGGKWGRSILLIGKFHTQLGMAGCSLHQEGRQRSTKPQRARDGQGHKCNQCKEVSGHGENGRKGMGVLKSMRFPENRVEKAKMGGGRYVKSALEAVAPSAGKGCRAALHPSRERHPDAPQSGPWDR